MISISEQDEKYIQEQPLETSLHHVRSAFQVASKKPAPDASTDETTDVASRRDAISNLVSALLIHPVAKQLRSAPSQRPLNRELAFIYGRLDSDDFDLSPFSHLTALIADEAKDVEIWQAVLQLIATLARTTPQIKSIPPSFCGTPFTRSSASFQDSNQTRSDLQQPLLTELNGCTFENVTGFFSKYFEERAWTNQSEEIYELLKDRNAGEPLQDFPKIRSEDQIWDWWDTFQQQHLGEAPGVYCQTKSKKEVQGAQGERQLDLILKRRSTLRTEKYDVRDFLVIGELTSSDKSATWKRKFLQRATYMRDIFSAQPTRRFVHGFPCKGLLWRLSKTTP